MTFTAELASKVTASHLGRDAYVYVRQSTRQIQRPPSWFFDQPLHG